jgi:hypothetical protein
LFFLLSTYLNIQTNIQKGYIGQFAERFANQYVLVRIGTAKKSLRDFPGVCAKHTLPMWGYGAWAVAGVVGSVAAGAAMRVPSMVANALTRTGIAYFTDTRKSSYAGYYKKMIKEGVVHDLIIRLLVEYADQGFSSREISPAISQRVGSEYVSGDVLCFRWDSSFYDYSAHGRARVRIYYDGLYAVIMCKTRAQLIEFCTCFTNTAFDTKSLVFIGVG